MKERYFTIIFWKKAIRHYRLIITRKVNYPFITYFQAKLDFTLDNAIIMFGIPRGGTTWLMELLCKATGSIPNFEPLHGTQGVVPQNLNLRSYKFHNKFEKDQPYVAFLQQVFTGKKYNFWTMIYTKIYHFRRPKYLLTKIIRGNHLLPMMASQMEFPHSPILIIRHPIPTCQSQLKVFGNNGKATRLTSAQIDAGHKTLRKHKEFLLAQHSHLAYKVLIWCINHVFIFQDKTVLNQFIVVFYEDLLIDPESELKRILKEARISNIPEHKLTSVKFRRPSQTDFNNELKPQPLQQLNKGIDFLTQSEKDEVQAILDYFSFKIYSADSPTPNKQHI